MNCLKAMTFGFLASACAVTTTVATPSFTGFYIGVDGGGSYWRIKDKADKANTFANTREKDGDFESKMLGRIGGFVGGGKEFCNGFYIGAQIGGGAMFGTLEHKGAFKDQAFAKENGGTGLSFDAEYKTRYYYNADVQFGYVVTPGCLIYLSGGFEGQGTRLNLSSSGTDLFKAIKLEDGDRTQVPFGTVGLGMRYMFSNGLFVGCEAKAMFGAKKTWKIKKLEKLETKFDTIGALYSGASVADLELVESEVKNANAVGVSVVLAESKTESNVLLNGKDVNFNGAQAELASLLSQAQSNLNKAKDEANKFSGDEIKRKTRVQNYSFTVSVGYKF